MLRLPESGFQPSIKSHNVDLDIFVDWIEGSIAFIDEEISQTDVVDILHENGIYRSQDFAMEFVQDAWTELSRRSLIMQTGTPFQIDGRKIRRKFTWKEYPSYSFCVLLSLQAWNKSWAKQFGSNYSTQGDLFEQLTAECLESLGWKVFRTGWTPGNANKIKKIVERVSNHIGEPEIPGAINTWIAENSNDEGLDVICSDPFHDQWGGRPLYFFQCASGSDWENKLHTPDPEVWRRIISFTNVPKRGFAMPFALRENDFRRNAGRVNGIFLDRFRLQSPAVSVGPTWSSNVLSKKILHWMASRVRKLPDDRS